MEQASERDKLFERLPETRRPEPAPVRSSLTRTGILPGQALRALIASGEIKGAPEILPDQVQPASLDLRLGKVAYRIRASFLPGPSATVQRPRCGDGRRRSGSGTRRTRSATSSG